MLTNEEAVPMVEDDGEQLGTVMLNNSPAACKSRFNEPLQENIAKPVASW